VSELAIEVDRLTKRFGITRGTEVVSNLTFNVPRGHIYGFIGPNGAGKTTTMRILATVLQPTCGKIRILSHDLKDTALIRGRIGYLPEMTALYDRLTVREYLEVFAYAYGIPSSKRKTVVDDAIELLDLGQAFGKIINSLSKGMKQRVALARCLIHDPALLLLDEPASGLDPHGRMEMRELLRELRSMGKTIFVSSHVLAELEDICDSLGIIERGKLLFSGTIQELKDSLQIKPHFVVRANPPEATASAMGIPGVSMVSRNEQETVFSLDAGVSQSDVAAAIISNGGTLIELVEKKVSLESMFVEFTKGTVA
jgi:ABC-2 type transport system ATP-binding protein